MAALCARPMAAAALSQASLVGLKSAKANVAVKGLPSLRRVAVRASVPNVIEKAAEALKKEENQNAVAATLAGSFFSMLAAAPSASAAQEIMALADSDTRVLSLLVPLVPALGWVLFNILKPALNQLNKMQGAKSVALATGLGAAAYALSAENADAAELVADLAADNRPFAILVVVAAAFGWVLFNIAAPALRQFNSMQSKKGLIGAAGLGAAGLLVANDANAAQLVAELADDNRAAALLVPLIPAVGWVLFNIGQPALRQLNAMQSKKGLVGAVGLGAAGMLVAGDANAAQLVAELADDNRAFALLVPIVPALGWVLFNIAKPALNQLNKMLGAPSGGSKKAKALVAGLGLSALMALSPESADAAELVATLADDNRAAALLIPLIPAIGWVLFNITGPALNQLNKMTGGSFGVTKKSKK